MDDNLNQQNFEDYLNSLDNRITSYISYLDECLTKTDETMSVLEELYEGNQLKDVDLKSVIVNKDLIEDEEYQREIQNAASEDQNLKFLIRNKALREQELDANDEELENINNNVDDLYRRLDDIVNGY